MAHSTHDPVIDLLYDDLDEREAEAIRRDLDDDARARLEDYTLIQHAYDVIADADEPSHTTHQNILRAARLASDERAQAREKRGVLAALFTPTFALAALLLVAAAASVFVLSRSSDSAIDRPASNSDIVAVGVETTTPERVAKATTDPPPEEPAGAGGAALGAGSGAPIQDAPDETAAAAETTDDADDQVVAKLDPEPKAQPRKSKTKLRKRSGGDADRKDSDVSQVAEQRLQPQALPTLDAGSGSSYTNPPYPSAGSSSSSSGSMAGSVPVQNNLDLLSPDDQQQAVEGSDLQFAIARYGMGDYAGAIAALDGIDEATPEQRVQIHFFRGMAHAKLNQHLSATDDLRVIVEEHEDFARFDEARFTYAQQLVALGSVDEGRSLLEAIAEDSGSRYADSAGAALQSLDGRGGSGSSYQTAPARGDEKKASRRSKKKSRKKKSSAPSSRSKSSFDFSESDSAITVD